MICLFMSAAVTVEMTVMVPLPYLLERNFGMTNETVVGAFCMMIGLGNLIGSPLGGRLSDKALVRYKKEGSDTLLPENRLRACFPGALVLLPASAIAYGLIFRFSEQLDLASTLIILGSLFVSGIGVDMCFAPSIAYISDTLDTNRVEGLAANGAVRALALSLSSACIVPLIKTIGVLWSFVILAVNMLLCSGVLFFLLRGSDSHGHQRY